MTPEVFQRIFIYGMFKTPNSAYTYEVPQTELNRNMISILKR